MTTPINSYLNQMTSPTETNSANPGQVKNRGRKWLKIFAIALAILFGIPLFLVFVNDALSAFAHRARGLEIGQMAPDFSSSDLQGNSVQLSQYLKQHNGKPVVMMFWATDCEECLGEIRALQTIAQDPSVDAIPLIVAVNEPVETIQKFVSEQKITIPIFFDPSVKILALYQANRVPFTFFIKPDGTIGDKINPEAIQKGKLRAVLNTLLSSLSNPVSNPVSNLGRTKQP